MFWIAWKTLVTDRGKALSAVVGVVFSFVLMNVQGGLYLGLMEKTSLLVDQCEADLWIGRHQVENVDFPECIPLTWLNRVRGVGGVSQAEPYVIGSSAMTLPDGGFEPVWVIGSDRQSLLGGPASVVAGNLDEIRRPSAITIDEADLAKLGNPKVGEVVEINRRRARVVAMTRGLQNFITTPVVHTTTASAYAFTPVPPDSCSYVLVRLDHGADVSGVLDQLNSLLPDARILTAKEFRSVSQSYWMNRTGIGLSFGAATALGLVVGLLIVGQGLYGLAAEHLPEYGALKAIGASGRQMVSLIVAQAATVAALGTVIGIGLVVAIARQFTSPVTPIHVSAGLIAGSSGLVLLICIISTIPPIRRLQRVDPAMVLQG
ncbi:MAG TPA: FtsX-like permease family protein [Caulifigura sp.]|jgi:putative ABC transport system permease protein|nr:FtsX-like permease family protein [Caulifigura sp.]